MGRAVCRLSALACAALVSLVLSRLWGSAGDVVGVVERRLDPPERSNLSAFQNVVAAIKAGTGWRKNAGVSSTGGGNIETQVIELLEEARVLKTRWRLAGLEQALRDATQLSQTLVSLHADNGRVCRLVTEVHLELGEFLDSRGRAGDAVLVLRRGLDFGCCGGDDGRTFDGVSLMSRVEASLGRALCSLGGDEGAASVSAMHHFESAIQRVSNAGSGNDPAAPLTAVDAEVRTGFAECLLSEGNVTKALGEASAAWNVLKGNGGSVESLESRRLQQRLRRVRGQALHEGGKFEEALQIYGEILREAGASGGVLDNVDSALQVFGVMQDMVLGLRSLGRMDESWRWLREVERLQSVAVREIERSSRVESSNFLAKGAADPMLRASVARSRIIRAELILQGRTLGDRPPSFALALVNDAMADLKLGAPPADLESGLNSVGNVHLALGDGASAESAYREALALTVSRRGADTPQVAALYYNVGVAMYSRGDLRGALEVFKRALNIQMKSLDISNPDILASLGSISDVLTEQDCIGESLEIASRAVEAARANFAESHPLRIEAEMRAARLVASVHVLPNSTVNSFES